jgi:hypothetical protein
MDMAKQEAANQSSIAADAANPGKSALVFGRL